MTMTLFLLLSITAALVAFKLGALALASLWAARGAFSAQGLLIPATNRELPRTAGSGER